MNRRWLSENGSIRRLLLQFAAASVCLTASLRAEDTKLLWEIASGAEPAQFALAPAGYNDFLEHFGKIDSVFYIGLSNPKTDWPYVLPGPLDRWAGSYANARTQWDEMNTLPIGFGLATAGAEGMCVLRINCLDSSAQNPPSLQVSVNGTDFVQDLKPGMGGPLPTEAGPAAGQSLSFHFPASILRRGYNEIALRSLKGSWLLFGSLRLRVPPELALSRTLPTVVRSVAAVAHAVSNDPKRPATIRVSYYRFAKPGRLEVRVGEGPAADWDLSAGLHALEIPVPASPSGNPTRIRLMAEGETVYDSSLVLPASPPATPSDYVDPFMGTAHSRWIIAPGPWMPFSMVKIAPDNQPLSWCAGYDYGRNYIDCFSHIHEWTMAGLGMMPTVGPLKTKPGLDTGYSSRFDKASEHGGIGYYGVYLKDSKVKVELTATTRASLQRYTFPESDQSRVLFRFLLPSEYVMKVVGAQVRRLGPAQIEGAIVTDMADTRIPGKQAFTLHFVSEFDRPFGDLGGWQGDAVTERASELNLSGDCGAYVTFKTRAGEAVQVRTGISLVSVEDARRNLRDELASPFGWNFDAVVQNQRDTWNELFDRIEIETPDARERTRFYTNFYRALSGRNTWSDVSGDWIDPFGRKQTLADPKEVMLGSDALWTTFWNLNQLMDLAAPEWAERWTRSELQLYDTCGWLAKGPAGLKYIPIMVAEHEIPLMVGAYQAGLRDLDGKKILEAAVKMQTVSPVPHLPGGGRVGNQNLDSYLKLGYIPADGPDKGKASNTFEYSYDDWCVAELARALGQNDIADRFFKRSQNWRNAFDAESGFIRPRLMNGDWVSPFDPYHSPGFTEANAWQYTWFVPHDVPGLVQAMGPERFVTRLDGAFQKMVASRFNAHNSGMAEFPLNQGNETAMQAPWLFNWANRPWLTQKWTRAVLDAYYGFNPADAYLGDEDQGQMAAWFIMSAMGLFQMDGGCGVHPIYEVGSPLYSKITIHLSEQYFGGKDFVIEAQHLTSENRYIQSASLNGKPLNQWWIPQPDVVGGGVLKLEMGPQPNQDWAKDCALPNR